MIREILRDKNKVRLGEIRNIGNRVVLLAPNGTLLGYYNILENITRDKNGFVLGEGNLLIFLL